MVRLSQQYPTPSTNFCLRVLLLRTDTMTKASLIKKKQHLIGAGLQVQRVRPFLSRWEHGGIQTSMVQEELRVLHLHVKAASRTLVSRQLGWGYYYYYYYYYYLLVIFFIYITNVIPFPGFPPSWKYPITSSLLLFLWQCYFTHPPAPTSKPSIPLHWGIYWAFIGPRTSPPIDAWQGHPLLHMQLQPCVLLCWWLSPWLVGDWLVDIVVLPVGLQFPSTPSVLSLTPLLGNPHSVQRLAAS